MSNDQLMDEINRVTIEHLSTPESQRTIRNRVFGHRRVHRFDGQWYFSPNWPWSFIHHKAKSWTDAVRMAGDHMKSGGVGYGTTGIL